MKNKRGKENKWLWILAFIIIPLLAIVIGVTNNPHISFILDDQETPSCPDSFNGYFKISFKNDGGGTNLLVKINSTNLTFTKNENKFYIPRDSKEYPFEFKLDNVEYESFINTTIDYEYSYRIFWFILQKFGDSCDYTKQKYSSNFQLIK